MDSTLKKKSRPIGVGPKYSRRQNFKPDIGDQEIYLCIPKVHPVNHRIKRILINTNLPYLEHLAFKLQQLFSHSFLGEIRTFQAIQNIQRKKFYLLKPSRFKKNQVSHLEPKSHKRLQWLLSTNTERANHIVSIIHQIERFNQTFIHKSTSIHHLIKLRVIHIQQLDSAISILFLSSSLQQSYPEKINSGISAAFPQLLCNPSFHQFSIRSSYPILTGRMVLEPLFRYSLFHLIFHFFINTSSSIHLESESLITIH
ncbi:hypothetical protein YC2023_010964 [Brassica napus]